MSITAAVPTAKARPRRTRTKRVSGLPAIKLSGLPLHHIDLRNPLKAVLVCEDCETWVPITGMQSKVQKLVPHHTGKAHVAAAVHCRSSNRRIEFDITISEWRYALIDAATEASSRQATAVLPKAFSPQTDQTLRGRSERGAVGRRAEWAAALHRVRQADQLRRTVPQGARPTDGPEAPLVSHQAAAQPEERQLQCERCGGTASSLVEAVAAGWCRITRRPHCGRCAQRFPAWTRTSL
ncbi:hypothetical protein OOK43_31880 [[Kitasatospora] papulosa]|uniref:hypothetical protein n=1 Tax=[Kitasatospora] papulosa TaxID=1464011 RepID=UPI0022519730|nr:hypothetical protein [[Kitasatospora] papulosa]MCX4417838.1 hypothetical protein [[Kitasatospora] papulosa]